MVFQLGASLLDACVLSTLNQGDVYGYILTQNIKTVVDVSESTLYPVLRRLQKDNCLEAYDQPFNGRNRRYYRITENGVNKLKFYETEWETYKSNVDKLLLKGNLLETSNNLMIGENNNEQN